MPGGKRIAAGGTIRIANGCTIDSGRVIDVRLPRNLLALVQIMEYLRAFLMARLALGKMQVLTVISGAFGLFSRQRVVEVGGYSHATVGEDMELVIKLHRHMRDIGTPYRIEFIAEPVCWTECPEDLAVLGRQRSRWQRGALECFSKHKDMCFNPRYGRIGFIGFGQILLVDVVGPVVEVLGYLLVPLLYWLGLLALPWLLAAWLTTTPQGVVLPEVRNRLRKAFMFGLLPADLDAGDSAPAPGASATLQVTLPGELAPDRLDQGQEHGERGHPPLQPARRAGGEETLPTEAPGEKEPV